MGDFSRDFHRPDAGITTVEGNVSGSRAMMLERKRQAEQEDFEAEKQKRMKASQNSALTIGSKFQAARVGSVEELTFKEKTIGLVTAAEFLKATMEIEETGEEVVAGPTNEEIKKEKKKLKKKKMAKKKMASRLSFMDDDPGDEAEEEEEAATKPVVSKKDPTVDTSFLPDQQRDEESRQERKRLELDWKERQDAIQKEALEITYSYWDGSGHRRTVVVTKGSSIGDFLEQVRKDLCGEFKELSAVASDALLYVKEDLIVPQDLTFYDLIVTKARGKSGPLFHFDVHEDVRLGPLDSRIEKDESHPGKVVERRWYERNKHIFPASRWELYDPATTYGNYSIHGGEVNKKKEK